MVFAALSDLRDYRIPNTAVLGIVLCALAYSALPGGHAALAWKEALLLFGGAVLCYAAGVIGGGDVKLLGACALWCPGQISSFLLAMACLGGVLAVGMLVYSRIRKRPPPPIPYGAAISAAALVCMTHVFGIT